MKDTNLRSITKGISWRIFASVDTFFISWLIFSNPFHAGSIASLEVLTKIILYFFHERLWNLIGFGRMNNGKVSHSRSLVKGVTWRITGSADTVLISWLITGKIIGAFQLGFFEILTKFILYYLHERIWVTIKWGRIFTESEIVKQEK